jgi:hypothetical protein
MTELPFSEEEIQERTAMYNDYVQKIMVAHKVPLRKAKRILKAITNKQIKKFNKTAFKNRNKEKIYINPEEALLETTGVVE